MKNFTIKDVTGVIPAMITTFDENENVDFRKAKIVIEDLILKGADALYITGSTGEGFLMSLEERKAFAECVMDVTAGRIPVVVHIGAIGTKMSIDLAKHAEKIGAAAISSVPPFYYGYSNEDIFNYYKDISDSVSLPMIVYNIKLAGLMNKDLIRQLATIEHVNGLKFTSREHDEMSALKIELGPDFMIYSGCDEMATQGLLAGADGIIGSTYNLMCDTFKEIYILAKEGKYVEAFEIQKVATAVTYNLLKSDFFPTLKACMRKMGIDAGYSRKPFIEPSDKKIQEIFDGIKSLSSYKRADSITLMKYL